MRENAVQMHISFATKYTRLGWFRFWTQWNAAQTYISFATKYTRLGWFGSGLERMQCKPTSHSQQSILDVHLRLLFLLSSSFQSFLWFGPQALGCHITTNNWGTRFATALLQTSENSPIPWTAFVFVFLFWVSIGLVVCHIYRAFPCVISMTFSIYWLLVQLHVTLKMTYRKLCSQTVFCWLCYHGHCCSIADCLTFFFFFFFNGKEIV